MEQQQKENKKYNRLTIEKDGTEAEMALYFPGLGERFTVRRVNAMLAITQEETVVIEDSRTVDMMEHFITEAMDRYRIRPGGETMKGVRNILVHEAIKKGLKPYAVGMTLDEILESKN